MQERLRLLTPSSNTELSNRLTPGPVVSVVTEENNFTLRKV